MADEKPKRQSPVARVYWRLYAEWVLHNVFAHEVDAKWYGDGLTTYSTILQLLKELQNEPAQT